MLIVWLSVGALLAAVLDPEPEFNRPGLLACFYLICLVLGPAMLAWALLEHLTGRR